MDELERARLAKVDDNLKLSAIDLLRMMIYDIEKGILKVDGLVILTALRPPSPARWVYETYRCGMSRDQELVTIVMAQDRTINRWKE